MEFALHCYKLCLNVPHTAGNSVPDLNIYYLLNTDTNMTNIGAQKLRGIALFGGKMAGTLFLMDGKRKTHKTPVALWCKLGCGCGGEGS